MATTTERLLALLTALQARRHWSGPELADHLDVTVRTIRRDIDRLRGLGYAIESDPGTAGGYRLGSGGTALPPLMLDEDEAVAIAVSLRAAADDSVAGIGEAATRALTKLEQLAPARARPVISAIDAAAMRLPDSSGDVDPAVFVAVSRACRERDVLRMAYTNAAGRASERLIEPYRAVHAGRRWYLVALEQAAARRGQPDDNGWRTFRLDRVASATPTGHRFERVDPPDPVALLQHAITTAPYRHQARVVLGVPIERAAELIPSTVGVLEAVDVDTTMLTTGANDLDLIVLHLAGLDIPFRAVEPPELHDRLAIIAARLQAAADDRFLTQSATGSQ